jgi:hypothetical protein
MKAWITSERDRFRMSGDTADLVNILIPQIERLAYLKVLRLR